MASKKKKKSNIKSEHSTHTNLNVLYFQFFQLQFLNTFSTILLQNWSIKASLANGNEYKWVFWEKYVQTFSRIRHRVIFLKLRSRDLYENEEEKWTKKLHTNKIIWHINGFFLSSFQLFGIFIKMLVNVIYGIGTCIFFNGNRRPIFMIFFVHFFPSTVELLVSAVLVYPNLWLKKKKKKKEAIKVRRYVIFN